VAGLRLTSDGLADVKLKITDGGAVPLHDGTRATIRAVGPAGLTNRYVNLTPGPARAPSLKDGAVLGTNRTTGIVDFDQILDSADPAARDSFRRFMRHNAEIFAGSGSRWFNGMLAKMSPAFQQIAGMTGEISADQARLERLVRTGAVASAAIASRRRDLESAIGNMARAFGALARERAAYSGMLARTPRVLRHGSRTLPLVRSTLTALRPALRQIPATSRPLRVVLKRLNETARGLAPPTRLLTGVVPSLDATFNGLRPLRPVAVPALRTTGTSLKDSMHLLAALREYGADLVIGLFGGLVGISASPYDQGGHYGRIQFMVSPQAQGAGLLSALAPRGELVPGLLSLRLNQDAPCPGGAAAPAPDGSNPWIADRSNCDPKHDHP